MGHENSSLEAYAKRSCFIPRTVVHHWHNPGLDTARVLTTLTPASIGPTYFRGLGALLAAGGPLDPAQVRDVMACYRLVVACLLPPAS